MQKNKINDKIDRLVNMQNITILHYRFISNQSAEASFFLEHELPTPSMILYRKTEFSYVWLINGFFGTQKSKEYLEDVKHKLTSLFNYFKINYFDANDITPNLNNNIRLYERVYELSDFNIADYRKRAVQEQYQEEVIQLLVLPGDGLEDKLFEASRHRVYALKRENRLTYDNVFNVLSSINISLFNSKYTYSYVKSKARRMMEWTEENYIGSGGDRTIYQREYMRVYRSSKGLRSMTRAEAAQKARDTKTEQVRIKISSAVTKLRDGGRLFKKNGQVNVAQLARMADVDRRSALKYVMQFLDV